MAIPPSAAAAAFDTTPLAALARYRDRWRTLNPEEIRNEQGHCWVIDLGFAGPDDSGDQGAVSDVELFEEHLPLGPRHSSHASIRQLGRGRFSHWRGTLYFATSDNTDPRENGRVYRVRSQSNLRRILRAVPGLTQLAQRHVQGSRAKGANPKD